MEYNAGHEIINNFPTVGDYVYSVIRNMIVNWELKPGQQVSEAEMSKILNVSRTPVRETFIRLKNEKLVTVVPHRGSFITKVNIEKVNEGLFIRNCLESMVLTEISGKITPDQILEARTFLQKQKEALEDGDAKKFYTHDRLFHKYFFDISNHKYTWSVINYSNAQSERVSMLTLIDIDKFESVYNVHEEILQAIMDNKPDLVAKITKESIYELLDEVKTLQDNHPEYFE